MSVSPPGSGRPSKKVYARRRLLVLLGLVAAIAVVVLLIVQPGSTSERPKPQVTPITSSSSEPSPSVTPTGDAATPKCEAKQIVVSAITDKGSYAAGEKPQLKMSITNTGSDACLINAGTAKQSFTISAGDDRVWTSTDCQVEPSDQMSKIDSGQTVTSAEAISWDRTRSSAETCDGARDAVPGGGATYQLSVSIDGNKSANAKRFVLE
ncbi:hypothetical protein D9V32_15615 [Mycetocola tolaasinivorans]|uniref:DUF4232 domain-containing protein n=1 Tax=Mycetocola tolaasinivorans TaxID=76635 RepID=A0A3L6ZWG5_9MICO|nr:hypothetical protein [Mycetocola tolaasinivorans]RLP72219.1 hypothetical protein D9V32_15615 [Mycetocola tolaasinivorans]